MPYDQDNVSAARLLGLDIVDCAAPRRHWADSLGRGGCLKIAAMSGRRVLKILAAAYIVQVAVAVVIGFTLPILRHFGVW